MEIRRLTLQDIPSVEYIFQNLIDESDRGRSFPSLQHWQNFFSNNACYFFACFESEMPIGYLLAYRFPSIYAETNLAYLYDIEVAAKHRQRGIGKQLIYHLIDGLKQDGVTEMWLGTETDNFPAQKLYLATGATQEPESFLEFTYDL